MGGTIRNNRRQSAAVGRGPKRTRRYRRPRHRMWRQAKKLSSPAIRLATRVDGTSAGRQIGDVAVGAYRFRVWSRPLSRGRPRRVVTVGPDRRDGRTPLAVCPDLSLRDVSIGRGLISRPVIPLERRRATGFSGVAASRADTFPRHDRLCEVQRRPGRGAPRRLTRQVERRTRRQPASTTTSDGRTRLGRRSCRRR